MAKERDKITSIQLHASTKEILKSYGAKGESYETIILMLMLKNKVMK